MTTRARLLLGLTLAGASALLSPARAEAKSSYPSYIQEFFCGSSFGNAGRSGCTQVYAPQSPICTDRSQPQPPCRLCHIQGTTGSGTIQTPFGVSMLARGLSGGNTSVCAALSALATDNVDSDGDGKTDVAELETFGDPNTAADVSWANEPTPSYGCGVAAGSRGGWLLATASTLVALFVLRRARRRT